MPGYQPITTNPNAGATVKFIRPKPPAAPVVAKQDPKHTEADYLSDVEKVTQARRPKSS